MDRIKRLSYEVLDTHKSKFGEDFADNKKALDQVSIVRSKGLKNEVAGYITKFIKKEIREQKAKEAQIASSKAQEQEVQMEPEPVEATETAEAPAAEETENTEAPAVEATETTEAPAAETTEAPAAETTEEKSE
ncbi:hypothetical protein Nisw_06825 [Candidatus Nitrosopumilus sp. SW]|uniref:40S ribosomal protein S17 n=1 Tax=Candidatus Nitrosopumilus sp. SW TaxID=2508726 RepID=UPI001152A4C3|nr:40S ribosomal protein S17 [Candidatus Nitrosopumilus sp. SW]QDI89255.1 hypothetical protein Nisw_06825 [Candidatus Nitrosopumilus sp. SW]